MLYLSWKNQFQEQNMIKHLFYSLFLLPLVYCSHNTQIIFDQSTYQNFLYHDLGRKNWYEVLTDSVAQVKGIYQADSAHQRYQIQLYNSQIGFAHIPLSKPLPFGNNSLIQLRGKLVRKKRNVAYVSHPLYFFELDPMQFELISPLNNISEKINKKYLEILPQLQRAITPQRSKLKLKIKPPWQLFYHDEKDEIIAISLQNDLMYQAAIEFYCDAKTGKIKRVQANEWFKGEI